MVDIISNDREKLNGVDYLKRGYNIDHAHGREPKPFILDRKGTIPLPEDIRWNPASYIDLSKLPINTYIKLGGEFIEYLLWKYRNDAVALGQIDIFHPPKGRYYGRSIDFGVYHHKKKLWEKEPDLVFYPEQYAVGASMGMPYFAEDAQGVLVSKPDEGWMDGCRQIEICLPR